MTKPSAERDIKAAIRLALGARPDVRLFNNPVGHGWTGSAVTTRDGSVLIRDARPVRFGLAPGSSDLIGLTSIVITPDMVGQSVAVFAALECKTARGRATAEQQAFIDMVRRFGGVGGVVRSVEDAAQLVEAGPDWGIDLWA